MRSCMVRSIEPHWRAEKRGIRGRSATSPRRPERIRGFDVLLLDQASNLKRPWDLPFRFPARRPNRPTPRYRVPISAPATIPALYIYVGRSSRDRQPCRRRRRGGEAHKAS
jgi:hypothetical protein